MNIILDRKLGSNYPISIGTALAMETLGQPSTPTSGHIIPKLPMQLKEYSVFAVSVNTLIKNLIESLDKDAKMPDNNLAHVFILDQIDQELSVMKKSMPDILKQIFCRKK